MRCLEMFAEARDRNRWPKLAKAGMNAKLSQELVEFFAYVQGITFHRLEEDAWRLFRDLVGQALDCMRMPEYRIPPDYAVQLIRLNGAIANAVDISGLGTTDAILKGFEGQKGCFWKTLALYNCRNIGVLDVGKLFDADVMAASLWYWWYFVGVGSYPSPIVYANMKRHVEDFDQRLEVMDDSVITGYYNSTYISPRGYLPLKGHINRRVRTLLKTEGAWRRGEGKGDGTIAVVSCKWFEASSVHRCFGAGVDELVRSGRRVELVNLNHGGDRVADPGFARVLGMKDVKEACQNWSLVFYPEIGMTFESICLSNMRLAPVQVTGYGHPTSTGGSEIDVFLGGEAVELKLDLAKNFYAERLVLLPGNGQVTHRAPHMDVELARKRARERKTETRLVINCCWSQDKTTWPLVESLRCVLDGVGGGKGTVARLFPNGALMRYNQFLPYVRALQDALGEERVEVHPVYGQDYLDKVAEGDLALDSWPFAGYNTVIDNLLLGIPVVALKGQQCFEQVGSELLERVGLNELATHNVAEWVAWTHHLANDAELRKKFKDRLTIVDWDGLVFGQENGAELAQTLEGLI